MIWICAPWAECGRHLSGAPRIPFVRCQCAKPFAFQNVKNLFGVVVLVQRRRFAGRQHHDENSRSLRVALKVLGSNLVLDRKKPRGSCIKPWSLRVETSLSGGMVPASGIEPLTSGL
jgi:hypothetical protein